MSTCTWQHHLALRLSIPVFACMAYAIQAYAGMERSTADQIMNLSNVLAHVLKYKPLALFKYLQKKPHNMILYLHSWICLKNGGLWVQQEILVHTELIMNQPSKCGHNPHLWLSRVPHSYQTLHELASEFLYDALPGGAGFVRDERYGTREAIELIKAMYQLFITATVSQTYQNKDRMKQVFVKAHQPGQ